MTTDLAEVVVRHRDDDGRVAFSPAWGRAAEDAVTDACRYALRDVVGPTPDEPSSSRAERPVWSRTTLR